MRTTAITGYWGAGRSFRSRFVTAVCGVAALAIAAIAAATISGSGATSTAPEPATISVSGARISNVPAPITYYVVASQEEAGRISGVLERDEGAAMAAGAELSPRQNIVLVVDSPEKEQMLQLILQDINAHALASPATAVEVVDLRAP
jgi:hypothetical protein